ncbi:MAG: hypothetical protein C0483_08680 [Pirellula sp.]|nr:hypothetical protein [Pirellula sp.]
MFSGTISMCPRAILIVAVVIAFASTSHTASAQSGQINLEHSKIYVFVGKKGAGHEHGVEGKLAAGELHLDRAQDSGSLTFDVRSFAADTDAARKFFNLPGQTDADTQTQVNANMHGKAVLDSAKFPTAEFVIKTVQALPQQPNVAGQPYQLDGEFTLHGIKKPLRIAATGESVNGWLRLRGRFSMKQTDFEITPYSKFLGAVGVTDELRVYGDLWIRP